MALAACRVGHGIRQPDFARPVVSMITALLPSGQSSCSARLYERVESSETLGEIVLPGPTHGRCAREVIQWTARSSGYS